MKKKLTRLFSVLLAAVLVLGTLPVSAMGTDVADPPASAVDDTPAEVSAAEPEEASVVDETPDGEKAQSSEVEAAAVQPDGTVEGYEMNIFFLDCGRKYYSVDSIKKLIDNASAAGFNYIQLAVGNDGMRLLLDDMSLTVGDKTYSSDAVKTAVHKGNVTYDNKKSYSTNVDELTQSQMNEIIAYAQSKKMGVIPCVNTPGHMDAILAAATFLTGGDCSYSESVRTIDVTNTTATAFTKAFLQKYITYFSDRGCKYFNMGADEYANDIFTGGSMGFGNLQNSNKYSYYVTYVNQVAELIENADMTPMAFNDGIYFKNDTSSGTFDPKIVICYWSQGWNSSYAPATAATLLAKGHKLVNTNGDYYWVLGGSKCTAETAKEFSYEVFAKQGSNETLYRSLGSMFCIWADNPGELTEAQVIANSAATIQAFGGACPTVKKVTETPVAPNKLTITVGSNNENDTSSDNTLTIGATISMRASKAADWTATNDNVVITPPDENVASNGAGTAVQAETVNVKAVKAGEVTITATDPEDETNSASTTLTVNDKETKEILVSVNGSESITVNGKLTAGTVEDSSIATVGVENFSESTARLKEVSRIESGKQYLIYNQRKKELLQGQVVSRQWGSNYITAVEVDGLAGANSKDLWTLTGTSNENIFTGSVVSANANYSATNGQYLSVGNNTATLSATANNDLVLTFHDEPEDEVDYWTIAQTVNGTTYYLNDFAETSAAAGWGGNGAATDAGSKWTIYEIVPAGDRTKITFNGVREGTTTVEIGNVIYTIRVVPDELNAVDPLTIEYWVTNTQVTAGGDTSKQIKATDAGVHSEAGADIASLIPEKGITNSNHNTVFKQARILDTKLKNNSKSGTELQSDTGGDDDTASGYRFTKVRYWNATWQVYTTDWVDVNLTEVSVEYKDPKNNVQTYTGTQSQLVAYHMQRTTVTEEVTTDVTDWGNNVGEVNWHPYDYVELDFAVKYENGLQTPTTFPVKDANGGTKATKTMEFHAHDTTTVDAQGNKYRRIGRVDTINTKDYSVYMITLTPTSDTVTDKLSIGDTARPESYEYKGTEKVVWVDSVDNLGKYGDESLQAPQFRIGGEPTIDYIDIYSRQGMLVTYYVRANVTKDSLQVRYVDKTTGNLIYDYSIAVAQGTYFQDGVALNQPNWQGPLYNGTVTNLQKHEIAVSADLSTMPAIAAGYRYAKYTCESVTRSDDKKVLTLYYVFDTVCSFVVDFGTPLNISLSDFNPELEEKKDGINKVTVTNPEHSKVTYDKDTQTVVFDPDKGFVADNDGEEFSVTFAGTNPGTHEENGISYIVRVYPASNVLYEEGFLTTEETRWSAKNFADHTKAQETQKVGDTETTYNVFGYDANASAVGANGYWQMENLDQKNDLGKPLTTTFYGNAFDLIGDCGEDTGRVLIAIINKDDSSQRVKMIDVDTRYNAGTLHQVPLAHAVMTGDAHYQVEIYATKLPESTTTVNTPRGVASYAYDASAEEDEFLNQVLDAYGITMDDVDYISTATADTLDADSNGVAVYSSTRTATSTITHKKGTHVEIDGFRVYRSTADDVAKNYPESEQNVEYKNILDVVGSVVTAYTEGGTVTECAVTAYEAQGGPQNEIYLGKDQSVVIQVSNAKPIQVSLRAVSGETSWSTSSSSQNVTITSNTEMYYTITPDSNNTVTITNKGENLLALGNVKAKNTEKFVSAENMDPEDVLESVRAAYGSSSEEPEVFTPETFTVKTTSTPVIRNKVVTLKVNVSSDVAYITVNGVKYTRTGLQGLFQKTRTIRVVNTVKKGQTKTYEVIAYNADGVASETITVTG